VEEEVVEVVEAGNRSSAYESRKTDLMSHGDLVILINHIKIFEVKQ
jgi:hypothetical protein